MLKRTIDYEDFEGEKQSEIFYFNLSKPELLELEVEHKQGLRKLLQDIIDMKDNKQLLQKFKEIVLLSYGEKSEDGKRFVKSETLREEFSQTAAYIALYMELASVPGAAEKFITGVMPQDMREPQDQDKPTGPPALKTVPPAPPVPPT